MTILLVNDDGYTREGIVCLEEALAGKGHEVWVVSPSSNRSAQSHAMCLSGPVIMTRYAENHYHCSGTPVDCILYSIKGRLFKRTPDLVISGINHGYNCSSDILYSGTCSAASEAVLQGIPALAVSHQADEDGSYDFPSVARFVAENLDRLCSLAGSMSFVNLNFPPHFTNKVETADLGLLFYGDYPEVVSDDGTRLQLELREGEVSRSLTRTGDKTDIEVCQEGLIALSVVLVNPAVDHKAHERAKAMFS